MKVLVSVKRVMDYNVRIQVKTDGSGVATEGVKMSLNPFDEIAVEEAIRLKESGTANEIVVVSIGNHAAQEQLRSALAMGTDRAILVQTDDDIQPLNAARILSAVVKKEQPEIVLMGKQAIDDDCAQTPQMLAGLLEWPQATFASKLEIIGESAKVTREVDAGLQTLSIDLPAVISADLRLNEPRFIKLPEIMKAKRKPIETIAVGDLSVNLSPGLTILNTMPPPARTTGVKVETAAQLVSLLKEKGIL